MSEQLRLHGGAQIREWVTKNGFDVVSFESDAPRFFQPRFTPAAGPMYLFNIEHSYLASGGQPMVSLTRVFRATSAEDALQQYLREAKERSAGKAEEKVAFKLHTKAGATDSESISVVKQAESP